MNKLAAILIDFFRHYELLETETAFRKEIKGKHIILDDKDYEIYLSSMMKRSIKKEKENVKNAQKKIKKMKSVVKLCAPKKRKDLTEEETEDIMENLMNRLFTNYNIFGESKLNSNIEKIFENNMFQKLYNETDVLKEAFEDSENDNSSNIKNNSKKISSANLIKNKVLESQILNKNDISINKSFHESHFMMKNPEKTDQMFKKKNFIEELSPSKDIQ
jgi:hypothetical protein